MTKKSNVYSEVEKLVNALAHLTLQEIAPVITVSGMENSVTCNDFGMPVNKKEAISFKLQSSNYMFKTNREK